MSVRVSELIERAQAHLATHGDSLVGVAVEARDGKSFLHIEPATKLGYDCYEEGGELFFEVECIETEDPY